MLYEPDGELFGDLTINLSGYYLEKDQAFIQDCISQELLDSFKEAGVIKKYCGKQKYNMGTYRMVQFDLDKLKELDYSGYNYYMETFSPFQISIFAGTFSVYLNDYDFNYDWDKEEKSDLVKTGDGHCYNDLFHDYLEDKHLGLSKQLNFDSESGMFNVNCNDFDDAVEVALILSELYKDEEKMTKLIKETKEKYNYRFNIKI